jgi:hypothetical protein
VFENFGFVLINHVILPTDVYRYDTEDDSQNKDTQQVVNVHFIMSVGECEATAANQKLQNYEDAAAAFQQYLTSLCITPSTVSIEGRFLPSPPMPQVPTPTPVTVSPPTPHGPPGPPGPPSVHSMGMNMNMNKDDENFAFPTTREAPDNAHHNDKALTFGMDLAVSIWSPSCAVDLSGLSTAAALDAIGAIFGCEVLSLEMVAPIVCVDCGSIPDVSNECPVAVLTDFCQNIANALLCMNAGAALAADPTPATDPVCEFDLNTQTGVDGYFVANCSAFRNLGVCPA